MEKIKYVRAKTTVLPLPRPLTIGGVTIASRDYATVEIETSAGLIGCSYSLARGAPVAEVVDRLLAPQLLGRELEDPSVEWLRLRKRLLQVGPFGIALKALGLVDVALWDLWGQRLGRPVWNLLGREEAKADAIVVAGYLAEGDSAESLASHLATLADAGAKRLKIARPAEEITCVDLLRAVEAKVRNASLIIDIGFAWNSTADAVAQVSQWPRLPLEWIEDPVSPYEVELCAAIHDALPYPVGAGDEVSDGLTHARLLERRAIDTLRIDILAGGGITPARSLIELAKQTATPVSFHVYPEISIHVAALSSGSTVEFFEDVPGGNPFDPARLLVVDGPELGLAFVRATDAPGLGFKLASRA